MTKYARKIEEIVTSSGDHPTAEQIFDQLRKTYPEVVLATVYNNLNSLTERKKIRRINIEGEPDHYDSSAVRHDHLRCDRCGRLTDIMLPDLTQMIEREAGEPVGSYDLMIHYICPECRRETEREAEQRGQYINASGSTEQLQKRICKEEKHGKQVRGNTDREES